MKTIATGLSLPKELKDQIDKERGDIPRSRYILRILEKHNRYVEKSDKKAQVESRSQPNTQPSAAFPSTTGGPER